MVKSVTTYIESIFDTFNYDDFSPKKSIEEIYSNTKEKIIKECFYWTLLEDNSKKIVSQ